MKKSRHHYVFVIDFLHFSCSAKLRAKSKRGEQMPKNATIQIKTLTPRQAINRTNENLRLGTKFTSQNIVVLENNLASTSFSAEKKERSQEDKEIGQKINALRASIKTYQKRISQTTDEKKIAKMQNKILGYEDEIQNLENQKSGNETRGRKKEKQFVEFIFSLTNTEPNNSDLNNRFALAQSNFLKKYFGSYELVTNVVHLDQTSLHAHAIVKLPKGKTWTELILKKTAQEVVFSDEQIKKRSAKPIYDGLKKGYEIIARSFQNFMAKELNIKFDKLKSGVFYVSLSKYKKQNPKKGGFNPLEASKIKKQPLERENIPLEQKNGSKSIFDILAEEAKEAQNELKQTTEEEEQPRSTELHHDDERGSSHGDVIKTKRKRARR